MGRIREFWALLQEAGAEFFRDNGFSRGAAISFYAMIAMGPILFICVWIAGLLVGSKAAHTRLFYEMRHLIGHGTAATLQAAMQGASSFHSVWTTVIGFVILVLTAGGVFIELQSALNAIWKTPDPPFTFRRMARTWLQAIALVPLMGVLFVFSLFVNALVSIFGRYFESLFGIGGSVVWVGNLVFSAFLLSLLFAAIYRVLPNRALLWHDVMAGAIITTVLILIGEYLIALYLGLTALSTRYGAAGGAIAVLMWIYYSAQMFLLGAELTKAWASRHGSAAARAAGHAENYRLDHPD